MICAFFGHRNLLLSSDIKEKIEREIRRLIEEEHVTEFWVCRQGNFDLFVHHCVRTLKLEYFPFITIYEICAYHPTENFSSSSLFTAILPEEVSLTFSKFAVLKRNDYIIKNADIFVCYVDTTYGGAFKAMEKAKKAGKRIINLADIN